MTDIFTASNGIAVTIKHDGYLIATTDDGVCHATGGADLGVQALREYFTAERDAELDRWRDPETGLLVYQINDDPDTVFVFDETYADHGTWTREQVGPTTTGFGAPIAERYFAAHPEPTPEWYYVEAGTFWRIHVDTGDTTGRRAIAHGDGTFTDHYGIGWKANEITHATQLLPEQGRGNE